jgi:hypothetical protein
MIHFYYQLEESYKSSMTDVFETSENGPSETKSPVARRVPEAYCPTITDRLKLMYSIPYKITIFLGLLYTTASSATYRRSHSCYKACGTFNYVTNAYCDETIIYNDPVCWSHHNTFIELNNMNANKV